MTRLFRGPFGALLATLLVLGALWPADAVQPLATFDQPFYLGIAHDLRHAGRFTDGFMFADPGPDGARPSGMRFAPLYPALLAAVAQLDPDLRRGMDCEVRTRGHDPACPRAAPVMRWLQFAMLAATFVLVWRIGLLVTGQRRLAWLTLLLALPTAGILLRSVDALMTETTALLLTTACTASVLSAWRRHSLPRLAAAGLLLGLAILTRPAFLYLLYAVLPAGLALAAATARLPRVTGRHRGPAARPALVGTAAAPGVPGAPGTAAARPAPGAADSPARAGPPRPRSARGPSPALRALAALAVFVLCAAAVVTPWVVRNAVVVGHAALTRGYDSHTLVQRISFDSMTWREYGLSYLCWLPDGPGLGRVLAGAHACDRFGWDERPDTFYSLGMGPLMQSTLAAAGGWDRHLGYLLTHFILREPLWHAAVTIPIALRGLWIDHYWGLLLGPCCALLTLHALRGTLRRLPGTVRPADRPQPARPRPDTPVADRPPDAARLATAGSGTEQADAGRPGAARLDAGRSGTPSTGSRAPLPSGARGKNPLPASLWPGDGAWQPCFLLLVLPAWFMLAFNAAVAVNQARYNLMLIPGLALSGALLLDPALRRALGRVPSPVRRRWDGVLATLDAGLRLPPWTRPGGRALSSAAPEAPQPPALPWRRPPLAARASGSARSNAAQRRRDPRAG